MSNQQPGGVWSTAGRQRQSHSASRTPQNRSGTASPNPQNPTAHLPGQNGTRPTNNVWMQRSTSAAGEGASPAATTTPTEESVNGFNAAEVKAFLARDAGSVTSYKVDDAAAASGAGRPSSAWGGKANVMANNQPFFAQLAKQITTLEGGG